MAEENFPVNELLEDETQAEKEFHEHNPNIVLHEANLRHSATTDTLDSVYLEPTQNEEDVQDIITSIHTLVRDPNDSDSTSGTVEVDRNLEPVTLSKVDTRHPDQGETCDKPAPSPEMNISSYFADQNSFEDPFSSAITAITTNNTEQTVQGEVFDQNVVKNEAVFVPKEINSFHQSLDPRLSAEEPESVDFQVEGDDNVMEASLQVIDEKEDFEQFTAENDPGPNFTDYGVSPSSNYLTERMNQMHMSESNNSESDKTGLGGSGYDRQFSVGSAHGSDTLQTPLPTAQFSSNQFSPFATPTHQPVPPPSMDPPICQIPIHSVLQPAEVVQPSETAPQNVLNYEVPQKTPPPTNAFSDTTGDDLFLSSIQMSDSDRQHDAWLPADHSNFTPVAENLSTPGLIVNEPQGDPVRDLVHRYMGEQEAIKRQILSVDSVSKDLDGLKKLIGGGCYRSAIDLTGKLLTEAGQGPDKVGQITTHTPNSLQLWYCRLALLMKLRYYSITESEFQAFHNLDTPDLYYEYYPRLYPGRKGSMVPFGMRILHAELPHYLGRSHDALDRLYYILAVAQKISKNLEEGLAEDGSSVEISTDSRQASTDLWQEREKQILYVIGNTFLAIKDYEAAISVYDTILCKDCVGKADLLSGMGRIYLQIGNVPRAKECFKQAEVLSDSHDSSVRCRNSINRGLEGMCSNNFSEAYRHFKAAVECDPSNSSAVNNMAVCSLYLGKLMDALKSLEVLVHEDPKRNLHEGVLFNLCTLYELESSRALHKKQALLDLVSRHKGDGFPVACLKMA